MTTGTTVTWARPLERLWKGGVLGPLSDAQLLEQFASGQAEATEMAFEAILERHGPMVLRACRDALDDPNDADDAFQATFLVLLRRAGSIRGRRCIAAWLYGVARRVAARARVESARRRRLEARAANPSESSYPGPLDEGAIVREEVARLPEKYRSPIVLCYLEGLTHEGAAQRLGWPVGTVRGRLARARDLLRTRLTRRGVAGAMASTVLGAFQESTAVVVPRALRQATLAAVSRLAAGGSLATAVGPRASAWALREGASSVSLRMGLIAGFFALGVGLIAAPAAQPGQDRVPRKDSPKPPPATREERSANLRAMLQLKGTWSSPQAETSHIFGMPQPPKHYNLIWSIDRDRITTTGPDGFAHWTYRFAIDPERNPQEIDLVSLNTGIAPKGIYKLEGDALTICFGIERPRGFDGSSTDIRIVFRRESRAPARVAPEFPNAPGCYWTIDPKGGIPGSMHTGGVGFMTRKDPDGAMVVTLGAMAKLADREPDAEYRPVAFDDEKGRHLFKLRNGGWSESAVFPGTVLGLSEFWLDPDELPFDRVRRLGIEVVPAEARREEEAAASARAFQEAGAAGIALLPRPEVGKPFGFALTASDGRGLRTDDLKGRVVLITCWASWSGPCTEAFPRLKALYQANRARGLEIIGLNFDRDRGIAARLVKNLDLPWPQVYVPADDRTRRLWKEGPGLPSSYPRILIIDRDGILRHDGGLEEIEKQIARWIGPGEQRDR